MSTDEEQQRNIRAAQRDAEIYGLESILKKELQKDTHTLEHFHIHLEHEKLKKKSKVDKLTYLYIGMVVGIILTLLVAVSFT